MRATPLGILLCVGLLAAACAPKLRPFPNADPIWVDSDESHLAERPADYWSGLAWDGIDQSLFLPMHRYFSLDLPGPAANVNSWDEVPNSSWFENRLGVRDMSLEELAQGSCPEAPLDPAGPWTVKGAKPNGANPGFIIKAQDGRRYLLKFDGHDQPERATVADVLGSRVYYAAGYHSPCNSVVHFEASILQMDPEAGSVDSLGRDIPMTQDHVDKVLAAGVRLPDGRYRASASLFLPGRPIGPWTYQGMRKDDPNDVIPHEDRRELRGARLLAAWLNHFDAREQNTLAIWVEEDDGRSYVRHYYLDFGDCLGSRWEDQDVMLSRRFGHSYYFDATDVSVDFLTLGTVPRRWEQVENREIAPIFGYYDVEHFVPEKWKAGYPNVSFNRMTPGDGAWMARIIARFTDERIRVLMAEGQLSNPVYREDLFRTLVGRRDRILAHYLRVRSPLADFRVVGDGDDQQVCFTDLAGVSGITNLRTTLYQSAMYFGSFGKPQWTRNENPSGVADPGEVCVALVEEGGRPAAGAGDAPADSPDRYAVLDLTVVEAPGPPSIPPARLHFYDQGDEGFRLVGIERPADATPPGKGW
ncbi:MAG: hypothetical protein JRI25_08650 [Deltaproteobacteria bacterium]|nr:hypothetical protein [Deltaproteobacteria bacterium]